MATRLGVRIGVLSASVAQWGLSSSELKCSLAQGLFNLIASPLKKKMNGICGEVAVS